MTKGFLKYPGGKSRLAAVIREYLPPVRRLIEPFCGSAAIWLNTDYPDALLADNNADLINLYQVLQEEGEAFIDYCRGYFAPETNTPEVYYELRRKFNTSYERREKAALLVYLGRHGFNGLIRYSARSGFNVPFGRYSKPYFPESEMRVFWVRSKHAQFEAADFRGTLAQARRGDTVFCDPPYVAWSDTANFTDYTVGGFGIADQEELASWAERLAADGITVVISNHATDWTRQLYKTAKQIIVDVPRFISRDGASRKAVQEIIAVYSQ